MSVIPEVTVHRKVRFALRMTLDVLAIIGLFYIVIILMGG